MVLDSTYVGSLIPYWPLGIILIKRNLCKSELGQQVAHFLTRELFTFVSAPPPPPPPSHCSEQLSSLHFYFSDFLYITFTYLLTIFHCILVILKFCILVKNIYEITSQLEVQFLSMNISTIGFTTNLAMQFILIIYLFLIDLKCYYVLFVNLYIFS